MHLPAIFHRNWQTAFGAVSPYTACGLNLANTIQIALKKLKNDWNPGMWVLIWDWQSYPMNTKMTRLRWFSKMFGLVLWRKVASENGSVNPITLRVPLESIICYSNTFENNSGTKQKCTKYLNESCCVASDKHFSFKCFPKYAFIRKIFPKSPGLFWPL